jgi:hypothetical protein
MKDSFFSAGLVEGAAVVVVTVEKFDVNMLPKPIELRLS